MNLPNYLRKSSASNIAERIQAARQHGHWQTKKAFIAFLKENKVDFSDENGVRNVIFSDRSSLDINLKTAAIVQQWDI